MSEQAEGNAPSGREPIWHDLDPPRPPSGHEARLLDELTAFVASPLLSEQVRTALVTATCACGCSSVRLATDAPAIAAEDVARWSSNGRDDYFAVRSRARPRTLRYVDVVLHVSGGRALELEVFDTRRGHGTPVPPDRITGLRELSLL